ncbi:MAG: MarR family transcriptional regulator [Ruminococcus sp.]|nr:MarR family transcriptional regulator [Ruminococcus sp.]
MNEAARKKTIDAVFELYPRSRKHIYESFDRLEDDLTRTQQMILLALSVQDDLSMSQLADRICTSNEQATRAVSQLVIKGYVNRAKNKQNRRVVNISLTDKARDYIAAAKKRAYDDSLDAVKHTSDEDMEIVRNAVEAILDVLNRTGSRTL